MEDQRLNSIVSKAELRQLEEKLSAVSERLTRIEARIENFQFTQNSFHDGLRSELKFVIAEHEKNEVKDFAALNASLAEMHQVMKQNIEALTTLRKIVSEQSIELDKLKNERSKVYGWIAGASLVVSLVWMALKEFIMK